MSRAEPCRSYLLTSSVPQSPIYKAVRLPRLPHNGRLIHFHEFKGFVEIRGAANDLGKREISRRGEIPRRETASANLRDLIEKVLKLAVLNSNRTDDRLVRCCRSLEYLILVVLWLIRFALRCANSLSSRVNSPQTENDAENHSEEQHSCLAVSCAPVINRELRM